VTHLAIVFLHPTLCRRLSEAEGFHASPEVIGPLLRVCGLQFFEEYSELEEIHLQGRFSEVNDFLFEFESGPELRGRF
jgi:hypothetical protein